MPRSTELKISAKHAAARQWAERGFAVFPCVPGSKAPIKLYPDAPKGQRGGVHLATTDLGRIDEWWRAHPDANIGCSPDASGCFVLDVDCKDGKDGYASLDALETEHGALPSTFTVRTPSGSDHRWFKGRLRSTAGALGAGLDTRGEGTGYVLLPGSEVDGVLYCSLGDDTIEVAPDWIAKCLGTFERRRELSTTDGLDEPHNIARAAEWLKLNVNDPKGRGGFGIACMIRDFGISEDVCIELMLAWNAQCTDQWDDDELTGKIANAFVYAQNQEGSKGHESIDKMFGGIDVAAVNKMVASAPAKPPSKFSILQRSLLAALKEPTWLYDGWFPNEGIGLAYGGKNSYKTFTNTTLALDLAAMGRKIAYMAGEGGAWGIWQRIRAWEAMRGAEMPETFYVLGAVPLGQRDQDWKDLFGALKPVLPEMVIGDTFTRMMMGQNANDFEAQSQTYGLFEEMCRALKCFGLLIGHSGKDKDRGMLGSSVAVLNADVVIEVEGNRDTMVSKWTCKNMRNAAEPKPLTWQGRLLEGSLAFDVVPYSEARKHDQIDKMDWERGDVGAALTQMGAFGLGHSVTTQALAVELCKIKGLFTSEPEHDDNASRIVAEGLRRAARGALAGYIVSPAGMQHRWAMPAVLEAD